MRRCELDVVAPLFGVDRTPALAERDGTRLAPSSVNCSSLILGPSGRDRGVVSPA